jgi:hypothetical protein
MRSAEKECGADCLARFCVFVTGTKGMGTSLWNFPCGTLGEIGIFTYRAIHLSEKGKTDTKTALSSKETFSYVL